MRSVPAFKVKQRVLVKFLKDPRYWHERLILRPLSGTEAVILTPALQMYVTSLNAPPLNDVKDAVVAVCSPTELQALGEVLRGLGLVAP